MRLRTRWIVVPSEKPRGVVEIALEVSRIHLQALDDHIHQLLGEILHLLIVLPVRDSAITSPHGLISRQQFVFAKSSINGEESLGLLLTRSRSSSGIPWFKAWKKPQFRHAALT